MIPVVLDTAAAAESVIPIGEGNAITKIVTGNVIGTVIETVTEIGTVTGTEAETGTRRHRGGTEITTGTRDGTGPRIEAKTAILKTVNVAGSAMARAIEADLGRLTSDAPDGTGKPWRRIIAPSRVSRQRYQKAASAAAQSRDAGCAISGSRNCRTDAISDSDVDGLASTPSNTLLSGPS